MEKNLPKKAVRNRTTIPLPKEFTDGFGKAAAERERRETEERKRRYEERQEAERAFDGMVDFLLTNEDAMSPRLQSSYMAMMARKIRELEDRIRAFEERNMAFG